MLIDTTRRRPIDFRGLIDLVMGRTTMMYRTEVTGFG